MTDKAYEDEIADFASLMVDETIATIRVQLVAGEGLAVSDQLAIVDQLIKERQRAAHVMQPSTSEEKQGGHILRQAIAQIISPASYSDDYVDRKAQVWGSRRDAKEYQMALRSEALVKADAILALTPDPIADAGKPIDATREAEIFRLAANLVYRIEHAGRLEDEGTNFERWKTTARALAPSLRAALNARDAA